MKIEDFNFILPEELIAQNPVTPRDSCKLLVLDRGKHSIDSRVFTDIARYFEAGDVLVLNDSKVLPARIQFKMSDKVFEIFLLKEKSAFTWQCLVKPGRKFELGVEFNLTDTVKAKVISIEDDGTRLIEFKGLVKPEDVLILGTIPLPPYIKNSNAKLDDYQTVYAKDNGSVAAPTAGLHFTPELLEKLKVKGVIIEFVTLHVGLGTFLPVKTEIVEEHKMHSEYYVMSEQTAKSLNEAKKRKNKVFAVGTTSVRVLESNFNESFTAGSGETDIYIYPGYKWKCVDGIITNFHLPKSTLLLLVSSFSGSDFILKAYNQAIKEKYRFYSFGDAMLIV